MYFLLKVFILRLLYAPSGAINNYLPAGIIIPTPLDVLLKNTFLKAYPLEDVSKGCLSFQEVLLINYLSSGTCPLKVLLNSLLLAL